MASEDLPPWLLWWIKAHFDPRDSTWFGGHHPGSFFGDLLIAFKRLGPYNGAGEPEMSHPVKYNGDAEAEAAIDRLAKKYFGRRAVFFGNRWIALEDAVSNMRRERDRPSENALYGELVKPALALAIYKGDWLKESSPQTVYAFLRKKVRTAIERDLLDGQTQDEGWHKGRRVLQEPLPEGESPEAIRLERAILAENVQCSPEDWVIILDKLARLSEPERQVLTGDLSGYSSAEQADAHGVSPATIRQRLVRLWRRLRGP